MSTAVNENLIRGIVGRGAGTAFKGRRPGGSFKVRHGFLWKRSTPTMGCFKMRPRLAKRHTSLICSFVKKGWLAAGAWKK